MITDILLKNVATYTFAEGVSITGFTKINFFYGANGSGKTTISRVISKSTKYPSCLLTWNTPQKKVYAYNEDFIEENFFQPERIKGVYTFGKEAKEIEEKIGLLKSENETAEEKIEKTKTALSNKTIEISNLEEEFTEKCWNVKGKFDEQFKEAFKGHRDSKESFKAKLLSQINSPTELKSEQFLIGKSETVFKKNIQELSNVNSINFSDFLGVESAPILTQKIIGKSDVDIAGLITKLGNSDWVKEGWKHLHQSEDICPFCQQKSPQNLQGQLEEYFDDSYSAQLRELENFKSTYEQQSRTFIGQIQQLYDSENPYIDKETLHDKIELINSIRALNVKKLQEKIEKPSLSIELATLIHVLGEVSSIVEAAQIKTVEHNQTVLNLTEEKTQLTSQIWRFIVSELDVDYKSYKTRLDNLKSAQNGLTDSISTKTEKIAERKKEIQELENQVTSIAGTIGIINSLLSQFGFTNFSLVESEKKGFYKVIREGGADAKSTLSEGEKTFLTFLYFYQLVQGSNETSGIAEDRIVVFDDPISSLDSDILFIVSSLIRKIISDVKLGTSFIKQVFILTHNVYFHKEITFKCDGNDFGHWVVKKQNKESAVIMSLRNPVQTSYQLLWDEVKESRGVTVHNSMRRILENYFKILGGIPIEDLINFFEGEDKLICKSLISWIHDGSHSIFDNLYVDNGEDISEKYQLVFKKIFENKGHLAHYNMMMGIVIE